MKLSEELETWRATDGAPTLQGLGAALRDRRLAIAFVVLPALPLPAGWAPHASELIAGRTGMSPPAAIAAGQVATSAAPAPTGARVALPEGMTVSATSRPIAKTPAAHQNAVV